MGEKDMAAGLTVIGLEEVTLSLGDGAPAFHHDNRRAIESYWAQVSAARPGLWNGPFFLFEDVVLDGARLSGTARRTDYATFLYWRDKCRPDGAVHITGTSLPVLADGSLFGVRMARHTANAGEVYFPAGSLDEADLVDGRFDITASISRELAEETGLVFDVAKAETGYTAVFDRGAFHIACRNRLALDFDACVDRLRRHQAETGDDEIDSAMAIRAQGEGVSVLKPYARALAEWHFANSGFLL